MKRYKTTLAVIALMGLSATTNAQENNDSIANDIAALRQEIDNLKNLRKQDSLTLSASNRQERIWKKSKPLIVAYGNQSLENEDLGITYKSDLSFAIAKRNTYYLHKKAILGMMKFGIDATWIDLTYARYAKGKGVSSLSEVFGNTLDGTFPDMDAYMTEALDNAREQGFNGLGNDLLQQFNLGHHAITAGMGVGPSLKIVPFYFMNKKALDNLKVTLYGHYAPSFCGILRMTGDDTDFAYGYMGLWRYGINLTYGRIGIGVERYQGKSKLNGWGTEEEEKSEDESFINGSSSKNKYIIKGLRFYLGVRF